MRRSSRSRRASVVPSWPACVESSQRVAHSGGMPSAFADLGRRAFRRHAAAQLGRDAARLARGTLPAPGPGGGAFADCFDEGAADGAFRHRVGGQIEGQQAHGALDVHPDRAGIDVGGRHHHAADGRAVARVGVRVEDEVRHARRAARVEGLFQAARVEALADGVRADDGDGLAVRAARGQEAGGLTGGGNQGSGGFGGHGGISLEQREENCGDKIEVTFYVLYR